jgi:4-oxalocrotonate tautomerase family enzyme
MPVSRIEVCKSRPEHEVQAFIEALYQAQIEALRVPPEDRTIRYVERPVERFAIRPDKSENYTLVEIQLFSGRSKEAKKKLYRSITERFAALGVDPSDVFIVIHEFPRENWGLNGVPASEIDLGYQIEV